MSSPDTLVASVRSPPLRPGSADPSPAGADPSRGKERPSDGEGYTQLVLGRYRLLECLGAGGFGVVWRSYDELLRREVAVKQIHLTPTGDHERAEREAQATARLAHPAIVALYEARAENETFYLISELVHGDTLAALIADGVLCEEETLQIGVALSDALQHAHARGVIHRDVKPQNILVPADPGEQSPAAETALAVAKLTDFGGARVSGEDALTRTGDVLGTLAYMAPEQIEGREATAAADLYSLALVLYEALCGVNPVRGRNPADTARRIGNVLEPLERRRGDLPRELTRALDVALLPRPAQRGTLPELRQALADALEHGLMRRRGRARPRRAPRLAPSLADAPAFEPVEPPRPTRRRGDAPRSQAPPPVGSPELPHTEDAPPVPRRPHLRLPRGAWLVVVAGTAIWQGAAGRPGVGLLLLVAALPLLLPRRLSPGWLMAGMAPALGMVGLAGVFPALAGQAPTWRVRACMAALGYWWLCLAESLLARRLWLGPPPGTGVTGAYYRVWEDSLSGAAVHAVGPVLSLGVLFGAALWGLAAALLPWLVRGRSAPLDLLAASLWTAALFAAAPLLDYGLPIAAGQPDPRGAVGAAILAGALAIAARALRGPV